MTQFALRCKVKCMNSASQSERSADTARALVADIERWTGQGRRMAAPAWFALLCVSIAVLAWVPASLLLGSASPVYWYVVAPLSAVVSGWFFSTRPAQSATRPGLIVLAAGLVMLAGALVLVAVYRGAWADAAPWLVLGAGLGVFAVCWRSVTTGAVAAVTVFSSVVVAAADPDQSQVVLALVVGVTSAVGAVADLVRTVDSRSAAVALPA